MTNQCKHLELRRDTDLAPLWYCPEPGCNFEIKPAPEPNLTPPEMRFSPVLERASTQPHGWVAEMEQDPKGIWTPVKSPAEPKAAPVCDDCIERFYEPAVKSSEQRAALDARLSERPKKPIDPDDISMHFPEE